MVEHVPAHPGQKRGTVVARHANRNEGDAQWPGDLTTTKDVADLGAGKHSTDDVAGGQDEDGQDELDQDAGE
jgi:hypothetical protein